jgi:hypothetical protein
MKTKTPGKRTKANYLGQLGRLATYRYGNHFVPDDNEGRAMLKAQLRCKLKIEDAQERAPWITDAELAELQRQAKKIPFNKIGELVGLKHAERWHDDVKMFSWAACDISAIDAARFLTERQRKQSAERSKAYRDNKETMRHTAKRDDAVLQMLKILPKEPHCAGLNPMAGWTPVSALVKEAKHYDAFRRPDGYALTNMRNAVHLVLKDLKANGQIEMVQHPGMRGMVMYVRLDAQELAPNVTYLRTKVTESVSAA